MAIDLRREGDHKPTSEPLDIHSGQGRFRLALLHGFQLTGAGRRIDLPHGSQRLLAFLALQTRPLSRAFVAASLWMDCSEGRAAGNLRSALWRLNRPGHAVVDASVSLLQLACDIAVDVREATRFARSLLDGGISGDEVRPEELMLTGELLPDWYDDWVLMERERFHQLRLHALETLCQQYAAARRFERAVDAGLAAVSSDPLRESAHRALIHAYLEEGNQAQAIRQYRSCQAILRSELGIEPSPVTKSLTRTLGIEG